MKRCAFLTTSDLEEFFIYDDLVKPHLQNLGWQVDDLIWHEQSNNYDNYDLVVVRSTWDYQAHPERFLACLSNIEMSSAVLENPYELMKWNFSKSYLQDLESKGVPILPTLWLPAFDNKTIQDAFVHFASEEIIIKPLISANADFTYRLTLEDFLFKQQNIKEEVGAKALMIQAFEKTIVDTGEFSLFYFDGEYSHAINKKPAEGDFRVQEEHGGQLKSIEASQDMLALAQVTIEALPCKALYARIDMLKTPQGLAIIEVELIEPSLYFNMDEMSSKRFAKALATR